jgi:hypothetical protein
MDLGQLPLVSYYIERNQGMKSPIISKNFLIDQNTLYLSMRLRLKTTIKTIIKVTHTYN